MKSYKFILPILALAAMATACDGDIETVQEMGQNVVQPFHASELYYQNLRDYKASEHPISFCWFSKYGGASSMALRFAGLPDSIDIVSLWGGIPNNPIDIAEMREHQQKKGTRFVIVDICRINKSENTLPYKAHWLDLEERYAAGEVTADERNAERHVIMQEMGLHYVDQIFENDIDGMDIDFEPEGDPVQGELFYTMIDEIAKYMGPNPNITREERYELIKERFGQAKADQPGSCDKLLCVDAYGQDPGASHVNPLINYFFSQDYHNAIGRSGYPASKIVRCVSVGEGWNVDPATGSTPQVGNYFTKQGLMYNYARMAAAGQCGGFGGFILSDDYTVCSLNPFPYARFRDCIQIMNPAIY